MVRSWGKVTLTGSAQPLFGDVTTAAVPLPDGYGKIPVTVASTTRYKVGDRIIIDPSGTHKDLLMIQEIASATVLNCYSEGGAPTYVHNNSTIIALDIAAADLLIQVEPGNTQAAWLGSDSTVTNVGGGSGFAQMQDTVPNAIPTDFRLTNVALYNVCRTTDLWIAGTALDIYYAAAVVL